MGRHNHLSRLTRIFALATVIAGGAAGSVAAEPPQPQPSYLTGAGHVPHGKEVDFSNFDALPPSWQKLIANSGHVVGYEGRSGRDLYDGLDSRLRAALLNIMAKSDATILPDHSSVLDHLREIMVIHQDRFFALTDDRLQKQVAASVADKTFYHRSKLGRILHHAVQNYKKTGSYKTHDAHGNLDITMSTNGESWRAEIDVDEWQGIVHLFREVAWHHAFHKLTNPYKVDPILDSKQNIATYYRIVPQKHAARTDQAISQNAPKIYP